MYSSSIFQRDMTGGRLFQDRADAARQLAATLAAYRGKHPLVVCLHTPANFHAVGQFFASFSQVEDEEAVALLNATEQAHR